MSIGITTKRQLKRGEKSAAIPYAVSGTEIVRLPGRLEVYHFWSNTPIKKGTWVHCEEIEGKHHIVTVDCS